MWLMREVRFSVGSAAGALANTFAGWPTVSGLQPYLQLRACLEGEPDPLTGYMCNITHIDRLLRERAIPLIEAACARKGLAIFEDRQEDGAHEQGGSPAEAGSKARVGSGSPPAKTGGSHRPAEAGPRTEHTLLRSVEAGPEVILIPERATQAEPTIEHILQRVVRELSPHAPAGTRWSWWELWVTPFLRYRAAAGDANMIELTQCFEFAAAHRLHSPSLSDRENQETFGKCNNPHGHNYQLEVSVVGEPDAAGGAVIPVIGLERIVKSRVIDRFDHKHLNEDCPEFAQLNPSVENIARVIWSLLEGQFGPARLARVRVWETGKTYAECCP